MSKIGQIVKTYCAGEVALNTEMRRKAYELGLRGMKPENGVGAMLRGLPGSDEPRANWLAGVLLMQGNEDRKKGCT